MDQPFLTNDEKLLTQVIPESAVAFDDESPFSDTDLEIFRKEEQKDALTLRKSIKNVIDFSRRKWFCFVFLIGFVIFSFAIYYGDWKKEAIDGVSWKTLLTLLSIGVMMTIILSELYHPGVVMMAIVGFLISCNVITPAQGFSGFADKSFITLIVSYILSEAIVKNRSLEFITRHVLPETYQTRVWPSLLLLVTIVALLSVVIDNMPVVMLGMSVVNSFKKTSGIPLSKVVLPISFAAILGGMNSVLGNSSFHRARKLLLEKVNELAKKGVHLDIKMPIFEISMATCIIAIPALIYSIFADRMLPKRKDLTTHITNKVYYFSFRVTEMSRFVGLPIGRTVLIKPPCGVLRTIRRGATYEEVTEDLIVQANDILCYTAPSRILNDVLTYNGIVPEDPTIQDLESTKVYEVSLNPADPLIGQKIDTLFELNVSVLGVSINEENWENEIKTIDILSATSTYILLAKSDQELQSDTFHIVTDIGIQLPAPTNLLKILFPILCLVIPCILEAFKVTSLAISGFVGVLVLILSGCLTVKELYGSIDVQVLCVLGASFGVSSAIDKSSVGTLLVLSATKWLYPLGKFGVLLGIFVPTLLLAQPLANTMIVDIMFPVVWNMYYGINDSSPHGAIIGIKSAMYTMMIASSSCFLMEIGYSTHLIVCRKAKYTMWEFFVFGLPVFVWVVLCGALLPYIFFEVRSQ
ncbi:sodium/sulfate transporter, putative [Entamoeba invadens IP1]|uniref:sodium/sulfate transporter, putative n=1 Tax=Entamoeba invadens IP1 TaxID=370355 RepID=UPI0002C3CFF2|nr:sodium/sulfate transporter, putative [Entamoeba invadens IP1]ELP93082.1 sodium/sulfate transporter, putative [Entamoeba invadens IP1]|eukprot:XP_004259853.1 sodium/sulfate transporter, putative [Entamoeba invadens IP1]